VGKSTVARAVARLLGLYHLDTGSTYRAATAAVLRAGVRPDDAAAVDAVVARADIAYLDGDVCLDGELLGDELRSEEVTAAVSAVSAIPDVRERIVEVQRAWVRERGGGAVVEGRDIGTVVFPEAAVKIYLTARPEIRAARRAGDAETSGKPVDEIAAELAERDRKDSTREASPLRPAADAVVIDTSDLTVEEVVAQVLAVARHATKAAPPSGRPRSHLE
jgi:cytidylate kinase